MYMIRIGYKCGKSKEVIQQTKSHIVCKLIHLRAKLLHI